MGKKNFAAMDKRNGDGAATAALARRFDDSRVGVFDAPLEELIPNPENPREPDDPRVREIQGSLRTVGQLQEIRVVTREVFLEAYPDQDTTLSAGRWVVIMGNQRLEAAKLEQLPSLRAQLSPDVASCQDIEDRIIHENVHRLDLPPLREAHLYQRKMDRDGLSARQLAAAVSKSHAYINQRLALLRLIPELQALINDGELGLKESRALTQLPAEHQRQVWHAGPPYTVPRHGGGNPVSTATDTNPTDTPGTQADPSTGTAHANGNPRTASSGNATATAGDEQDRQTDRPSEPVATPSTGERASRTFTIRGSSASELAQSLQAQLDPGILTELVHLLQD